jgi:hypothetical protein
VTFLSPLFLLAAAAAAVPVLLHLYHRHENRRVVFPALRYLLRTEREHARAIRLRQWLLLLLRVGVVLLLAVAGARPLLRGGNASHEPTALAVVLDNSLSSGRIVGAERVLDVLKARAREALQAAGPDDLVWVIRAGEPWDVAQPGAAADALDGVATTEPTAARGDLRAALVRASGLVLSAGMPAAEIHLLSDLQRTAFGGPGDAGPAGELPVVVYAAPGPDGPNRFLQRPVVGEGLPPLAGQRTRISVTVASSGAADTAPRLPVRVVTGERIRAVGSARPGEDVVLSLGPFAGGVVEGFVETDPDALGADDRRWFAFEVRPPVGVERRGGPSFFLDQGLEVLRRAGRVRSADSGADVLVSVGGDGLEDRSGVAAVVVPSADPALLPALDRRLAAAGIPWRYEAPEVGGEAEVAENRLPVDLQGVGVRRHYRLRPVGETAGSGADAPPAGAIPARLSSGDPLLVTGTASGGTWMLVATPFDPEWTDLPVGASMVPLLEWAVARWAAAGDERRRVLAGESLPTPPGATAVRDPEGTVHPVGGARAFRRTAAAGVYEVLAEDRVLERVAVNAPVAESLLDPLEAGEVEAAVGPGAVVVSDPAAWRRQVFRSRQGPEVWRPVLLVALALLLLEGWIAASGGRGRSASEDVGTGRSRTIGTPEGGWGDPLRESTPAGATRREDR